MPSHSFFAYSPPSESIETTYSFAFAAASPGWVAIHASASAPSFPA